jgi:hypothetical protein
MVDDNNRKELKTGYVALQEHFSQILTEKEKLFKEMFRANRESIDLARTQMDHRLQGMNEFQKRMDKLEGTFATKTELRTVEKLVYIGVGIVLTIQFITTIIIAVFGLAK